MFGFLFWFGVVGGRKPQWRVFRSQCWVLEGRWRDTVGIGEVRGGALWCGRRFLYIARMVPPEQRLVYFFVKGGVVD